MSDMSEQKKKIMAHYASMKKVQAKLNAQKEQLDQTKAALKERESNLRKREDEMKQEMRALLEQNEQLEAELVASQQNSDARVELEQNRKLISELSAENQRLAALVQHPKDSDNDELDRLRLMTGGLNAQIMDDATRIKKQEKEIARLKQSLSMGGGSNAGLLAELESKNQRIKELEEQLQSERGGNSAVAFSEPADGQKLQELKISNQKLQMALDAEQTAAAEARREASTHKKRLATLQSQLEDAEGEIEELEQHIEEVEEQLDTLKRGQKQSAKKSQAPVQEENEQLKAQLAEAHLAMQEMEERKQKESELKVQLEADIKDRLETMLEDEQAKAAAFEAEVETLKRQQEFEEQTARAESELASQLDEVETELAEYKGKVAAMEVERDSLLAQTAKLRQDHAAVEEMVGDLRQELEDVRMNADEEGARKLQLLQEHVEDLREQTLTVQAQYEDLQTSSAADLERVRVNHEESASEAERLAEELRILLTAKQQLEVALESGKNELRDKTLQLSAAEAEITVLKSDLLQQQNESSVLDESQVKANLDSEELKESKRKLQKLFSKFKEVEAKRKKLVAELSASRQETVSAVETSESLKEQIARMNAEAEQRDSQHADLQRQFEARGTHIVALEEQLEEAANKPTVIKEPPPETDDYKTKHAELAKKLMDMMGKMKRMKKAMDDLKKKEVAAEARAESSELEQQRTKKELVQAKGTVQTLTAELNASKDTVVELQARIEAMTSTESQLAQLTEECASLQQKLLDAGTYSASMMAARDEALGTASSVKEDLQKAEEQVAKLQKELQQTQQSHAETTEKHGFVEKQVLALEKALASEQQGRGALEQQHAEHLTKHNSLQNEHAQHMSQLNELQAAHAKLQEEHQQVVGNQVAQAPSNYFGENNDVEEANARVTALQNSLNKAEEDKKAALAQQAEEYEEKLSYEVEGKGEAEAQLQVELDNVAASAKLVETLKQENKKITEKNKGFAKKMGLAVEKLKKEKEERQKHKEQLKEYVKEIATVGKQKGEVEIQLATVQKDKDALTAKLEEQAKAHDDLSAKLKASEKKSVTLVATLDEHKLKLSQLEQAAEEDVHATCRDFLSAEKEETASLRRALDQATKEMGELKNAQEDFKSHSSRATSLASELVAAQDKVKNLENERDQLTRDVAALKTVDEANHQMRTDLSKLRAELADTLELSEQRREEAESLTWAKEEAEAHLGVAQKSLQEKMAELDAIRANGDEGKTNLADALKQKEEEIDELNQSVAESERELYKNKSDLTSMDAALAEKEMLIEQLQFKIEALETEDLDKADNLALEAEDKASELAALQASLAEKARTVHELNAEISRLKEAATPMNRSITSSPSLNDSRNLVESPQVGESGNDDKIQLQMAKLNKEKRIWRRQFAVLFARFLELRISAAGAQGMKSMNWISDNDSSEVWVNFGKKMGLGQAERKVPPSPQSPSKRSLTGVSGVVSYFETKDRKNVFSQSFMKKILNPNFASDWTETALVGSGIVTEGQILMSPTAAQDGQFEQQLQPSLSRETSGLSRGNSEVPGPFSRTASINVVEDGVLEEKDKQIEELTSQRDELQTKLTAAFAAQQTLNMDNEETLEENMQLKVQIDKLTDQLSEVQNGAPSGKEVIDSEAMQADIAAAVEAKTVLETQLETLRANHKAATAKLKKKLADTETKLNGVLNVVEQDEANKAAAAPIDESALRELEEKVTSAERDAGILQSQLDQVLVMLDFAQKDCQVYAQGVQERDAFMKTQGKKISVMEEERRKEVAEKQRKLEEEAEKKKQDEERLAAEEAEKEKNKGWFQKWREGNKGPKQAILTDNAMHWDEKLQKYVFPGQEDDSAADDAPALPPARVMLSAEPKALALPSKSGAAASDPQQILQRLGLKTTVVKRRTVSGGLMPTATTTNSAVTVSAAVPFTPPTVVQPFVPPSANPAPVTSNVAKDDAVEKKSKKKKRGWAARGEKKTREKKKANATPVDGMLPTMPVMPQAQNAFATKKKGLGSRYAPVDGADTTSTDASMNALFPVPGGGAFPMTTPNAAPFVPFVPAAIPVPISTPNETSTSTQPSDATPADAAPSVAPVPFVPAPMTAVAVSAVPAPAVDSGENAAEMQALRDELAAVKRELQKYKDEAANAAPSLHESRTATEWAQVAGEKEDEVASLREELAARAPASTEETQDEGKLLTTIRTLKKTLREEKRALSKANARIKELEKQLEVAKKTQSGIASDSGAQKELLDLKMKRQVEQADFQQQIAQLQSQLQNVVSHKEEKGGGDFAASPERQRLLHELADLKTELNDLRLSPAAPASNVDFAAVTKRLHASADDAASSPGCQITVGTSFLYMIFFALAASMSTTYVSASLAEE